MFYITMVIYIIIYINTKRKFLKTKIIFFRFNSPKDRENIFKSKWRQEILDKLIELKIREKEFQRFDTFT